MGQFVAAYATELLVASAVVGTTATVAASRKSAGAQQVELDLAKRQETAAATDRELQRKRRLNALLASQSTQAAAKGLQMSGSVANISITDAKRAGEDSMVDDANTRARINALSRQRSSIGKINKYRTAGTIMGTGERLVSSGIATGGKASKGKTKNKSEREQPYG